MLASRTRVLCAVALTIGALLAAGAPVANASPVDEVNEFLAGFLHDVPLPTGDCIDETCTIPLVENAPFTLGNTDPISVVDLDLDEEDGGVCVLGQGRKLTMEDGKIRVVAPGLTEGMVQTGDWVLELRLLVIPWANVDFGDEQPGVSPPSAYGHDVTVAPPTISTPACS